MIKIFSATSLLFQFDVKHPHGQAGIQLRGTKGRQLSGDWSGVMCNLCLELVARL